jgi:hypothetical protein
MCPGGLYDRSSEDVVRVAGRVGCANGCCLGTRPSWTPRRFEPRGAAIELGLGGDLGQPRSESADVGRWDVGRCILVHRIVE